MVFDLIYIVYWLFIMLRVLRDRKLVRVKDIGLDLFFLLCYCFIVFDFDFNFKGEV